MPPIFCVRPHAAQLLQVAEDVAAGHHGQFRVGEGRFLVGDAHPAHVLAGEHVHVLADLEGLQGALLGAGVGVVDEVHDHAARCGILGVLGGDLRDVVDGLAVGVGSLAAEGHEQAVAFQLLQRGQLIFAEGCLVLGRLRRCGGRHRGGRGRQGGVGRRGQRGRLLGYSLGGRGRRGRGLLAAAAGGDSQQQCQQNQEQ